MWSPFIRPARREPWNKGKVVGQKAPLKLKDIWSIRIRLELGERRRELALFNLAIDSKLRGCDLVRLRVRDVAHGDRIAARAIVLQQKTSVRSSLKSPSQPAKRFSRGFDARGSRPRTICFQVGCVGPRIFPLANTLASWRSGSRKSVWTPALMAHTPCAGLRRR
jgi:hypothetical protein